MGAFEYKALDSRGREQKGLLEGDSARHIRQQLRERSLIPLQVEEVSEQENTQRSRRQIFSRGVSVNDLALLTRQLATLSRAAIPLDEATSTVAKQSDKPRVKKLLLGVRSRVLEGYSLADGMRDYPHVFSEMYTATVAAGEQSGHLDLVLERLADYSEQRQQLQQRLQMALLYPVMLTVMSVLIVSFLLQNVVPKVVDVFTDTGQPLPWLTKALISVSEFTQNYFLLIIIMISGIAGLVAYLLRQPAIKKRFHHLVLGLPLIGSIVRGSSSARFARTLSILASSGVPILDALRIAAQVISNIAMREAVDTAARTVSEGSSLSTTLERSGYFSPMLISLIASGESSGNLEAMLERAAINQENELSSILSIMMGLLGPLLILLMGAVVLIIVLAILLPIFDLNMLVK